MLSHLITYFSGLFPLDLSKTYKSGNFVATILVQTSDKQQFEVRIMSKTKQSGKDEGIAQIILMETALTLLLLRYYRIDDYTLK